MDQKNFSKWIRKSWNCRKIIIIVEYHSNKCAYSWQGFADGILQEDWTLNTERTLFREKVLLAIWEIFFYENKLTLISCPFRMNQKHEIKCFES